MRAAPRAENPDVRSVLALLAIALLGSVPLRAADIHKGSVVVVPISGEITEAQFFFLRRAVKEAESKKAAAIVLDMDTYGGSLQAAVDMLGTLMKSTVPTYTYVNTNAGSAGSMIALSTQHIYMAPVSAIGAAAPVTGEGQDLQQTMNDKVVSYFSGYFRSAAEKNGYNPELAEAFINKQKEVKIGDKIINPVGSLLTLSSQEATRDYNGKPLLASGIAANIEDLCKEAKLPANDVVRVEPSGFETLAQLVTMIAPLLLLGGIVGAYLEFKSPGFGVPGVISAICFLLFSRGTTSRGSPDSRCLPPSCSGSFWWWSSWRSFRASRCSSCSVPALMLGSLLFAMVDYYPDQPFTIPMNSLLWPMAKLGLGAGAQHDLNRAARALFAQPADLPSPRSRGELPRRSIA